MKTISLTFENNDVGLNLTGEVNFPDAKVPVSGLPDSLHIRGLAEWRHVPANIVHVNENFISTFLLVERGKALSKIGVNWIGIRARSNIMLSFSCRQGKNGVKNVQALLTKFFKTIGASSIKFSILDVDRAMVEQNQPDDNE